LKEDYRACKKKITPMSTRIFRVVKYRSEGVSDGWHYEYKNKISVPFKSRREAEVALLLNLNPYPKPQRGRSDPQVP